MCYNNALYCVKLCDVFSCVQEWANRAEIPGHVVTMLNNFPHTMHPMAQFSAACNALSTESVFSKAYSDGVKKSEYWKVGVICVFA